MNNYGNTVTVVNISDIIWDLLSQWKMVLIVAIVMALLTTGFKYQKDIKVYKEKSSTANSENSDASNNTQSYEEHTRAILESLPEDERLTVEYMVQQKEWLEKEKDYINNSVLMNTDPTNQRTLMLDYYISSKENDNSSTAALAYAYSAYVFNEEVTESLCQIVSPNSDKKYMAELIDASELSNSRWISDSDAVIEIKIILPDDTDADLVERVITESLNDYTTELEKTMGMHSLRLLNSHEARQYNEKAVNNKNSIINSAYNINFTFLKNSEALLSDRQRAALSAITTYKQVTEGISEGGNEGPKEEIAKPGISKKYGLMGFILGGLLYALAYTLYSIIRGRVYSAKQVENYISGRIIGEVYFSEEHSGLSKLVHSRLVDSIRLGNKLDEGRQIRKMISSIKALSDYYEDSDITLFTLLKDNSENSEIKEKIIDHIKKEGIDIAIKGITEDTDDRVIDNTRKAICLIEKGSKVSNLAGFNKLMESFDIKQVGNIFVGQL